MSRIIVRRLLPESRYKLPEDYDYATGLPKNIKSKVTLVKDTPAKKKGVIEHEPEPKTQILGYQFINGAYRIEGTTALSKDSNWKLCKTNKDVKPCHFVCLMAMLMAAMHPIRTWDQVMIDTCIEKGLEISKKAVNLNVCEKRVIKNVILDGKFININIKKIIVVNENPDKTLEQYMKAVLRRLRYVMVRFPSNSLVVCQTDGYYHLFDPYPAPAEKAKAKKRDDEKKTGEGEEDEKKTDQKEVKTDKKELKLPAEPPEGEGKKMAAVASWTLYRSIDNLIARIRKISGKASIDEPEFYTFELTSVKTAPRHSALNYRLSPLFKPDENPNLPYLKRRKSRPLVDEKMYWLNIDMIPWSRMSPVNDLGFPRKTPKTMWKDWDIEFPGDLYSLWGNVHPLDDKFSEANRGKQHLATCVVALAMTHACNLSAWTGSFLDGIVNSGDEYHTKCAAKIGSKENHEIALTDLDGSFEMYPFAFTAKFENVIFGFVYNINQDRFNLSKALSLFFEKYQTGVLTSPSKNIAFGKMGTSYFMFDCQSYGAPIFSPGKGSSYMLKCESLNRLIYCITVTLNLRRHGQQFHLFDVTINLTEKAK